MSQAHRRIRYATTIVCWLASLPGRQLDDDHQHAAPRTPGRNAHRIRLSRLFYDYARLLLEYGFKEGDRFWIRNNGLTITQGILAGFFAQALRSFSRGDVSNPAIVFMIILAIIGLAVAVAHFFTLRASAHFKHAWLWDGFDDWTRRQARHQHQLIHGDPLNEPWHHLVHVRHIHYEGLPRPRLLTTQLAYFICFLFAFLWIAGLFTLSSYFVPDWWWYGFAVTSLFGFVLGILAVQLWLPHQDNRIPYFVRQWATNLGPDFEEFVSTVSGEVVHVLGSRSYQKVRLSAAADFGKWLPSTYVTTTSS